ncbi:MAG: hypothetical protein MZW92_44450 [Comamonadaceae bacterium]|nr:hypothetical protein [Comamonadaceae bacterium]
MFCVMGAIVGADRRPLRRPRRWPARCCTSSQTRDVALGGVGTVRHGLRHGRAAAAGRRCRRDRCCRAPASGWRASSASSACC